MYLGEPTKEEMEEARKEREWARKVMKDKDIDSIDSFLKSQLKSQTEEKYKTDPLPPTPWEEKEKKRKEENEVFEQQRKEKWRHEKNQNPRKEPPSFEYR